MTERPLPSRHGPLRLFRGAVVGTFASAFATWAHLLAGGPLPEAVTLWLLTAAAVAGCVIASRWAWRLPGLLAAMLLAQGSFHVGLGVYGPGGSGPSGFPGPAAHAGHGVHDAAVGPGAGGSGFLGLALPDTGMLMLHAAAALLLAVALRHGESVLGGLVDIVGLRPARSVRDAVVAVPTTKQALGVTALAALRAYEPVRLCWARGPPA
ncbi:MAG: hypothetical protein AVDCRST_MAG72-527 [uncultured Nocardioidaceae bacterium]|uniref:Uncharacterized protein n=1 Tax=uncultured Nocardioidaceae bacterium TaxID=253824 RepID=A0A6J4LLA4_9ACTN|nr:MAG: hypothetical protein AVDCRST_MAG72-527 [uncultured Nocardioidaceae bacterium]